MQVCHVSDCDAVQLVFHVLEGQLITPALRKYPMENFTWIPKGYVTDNWSVSVCLSADMFIH